MNKHKIIHIWASIKSLFIHVFGSKYTLIILDSIATIVISIHTANGNFASVEWINKLILYVSISILVNVVCVGADYLQKKHNSFLEYFSIVYDIQNK